MRKLSVYIVAAIVLALVVGVYVFDYICSGLIKEAMAKAKPPPPYVSTTVAKSENWQPRLKAVAVLTAVNGVTVTTEAAGIVVDIGYDAGQHVKQGQYLVQLDNSIDVQNLKNYQAQLYLAQLDYNRKAKLYKTAAIAKSDYDEAYAQLRQSQADVDRTLVQISQKRILAPFTGKMGIQQVNAGQYINPGDEIASLQALNLLYVDFSFAQRDLAKLYVGQAFSFTTDAFPHKTFHGKITSIDSQVAESTRNMNVQGTIPNPGNILYPGLFCEAKLYLPTQEKVVTVPQTTVDYSLFGDIVYVVSPAKEDKKSNSGKDKSNPKKGEKQKMYVLEQRVVKTGAMIQDKVQILSGVKAGEVVVTSGQLKLRDKMNVFINNSVKMIPPKPESLEGGA